MPQFKVPPESEQFVAELCTCAHDGIWDTQLESMSLVDMPIVWYFAPGATSPKSRARAFIDAVEHTIDHSFKGTRDEAVLRCLLALGDHRTEPLHQRNASVLEILNIGRSGWNSFRDYGRRRTLNRLVISLVREAEIMRESRHPGEFASQIASQHANGNLPPYMLRDYFVSYVYPENPESYRELIEVRELVALRTTTHWSGFLVYKDDARSLPPLVSLAGNAKLIMGRPTFGQKRLRQDLRVEFHHPVEAGATERFILHKKLPLAEPGEYQAPGDINFVRIVPSVAVQRYTVQVQHAGARRPRRAWSFDKIPSMLSPGDTLGTNQLEAGAPALTQTFNSLSHGLAYGIGWEW